MNIGMAGYRPSYTGDEDRIIINIIINTQSYYSVKSKSFWQDMETSGLLNRTWHSLKQRFENHIIPHLSGKSFDITDLERRKILLAFKQSSSSFKPQGTHVVEDSSEDSSVDGLPSDDGDHNDSDHNESDHNDQSIRISQSR